MSHKREHNEQSLEYSCLPKSSCLQKFAKILLWYFHLCHSWLPSITLLTGSTTYIFLWISLLINPSLSFHILFILTWQLVYPYSNHSVLCLFLFPKNKSTLFIGFLLTVESNGLQNMSKSIGSHRSFLQDPDFSLYHVGLQLFISNFAFHPRST